MESTAIESSEAPVSATFIRICGESFAIDDDYLRDMGKEFEPNTVALLCGKDSRAARYWHDGAGTFTDSRKRQKDKAFLVCARQKDTRTACNL